MQFFDKKHFNTIPFGVDDKGFVYHYEFTPTNTTVLGAGVTCSGKTNLLRNISLSLLKRGTDDNSLFIISVNKAKEYEEFEEYGVPVAKTMEEAISILSYLNSMLVDEKEEQGNIVLIIDELAELLLHNRKEYSEFTKKARKYIKNIALLGSNKNITQFIFTQRPSADLIDDVVKKSSKIRIGCGNLPQTVSDMLFEDETVDIIPNSPHRLIGIKNEKGYFTILDSFFAPEGVVQMYLGETRDIFENNKFISDYREYLER